MYQDLTIVGRLTRDPELKTFESGDSVCNFSVAVNETYTSRAGNQVEETTFFDCSIGGAQGLAVKQYKKKGDPVLVAGVIRFRKENPDDPKSRTFHTVRARTVKFLPNGGVRTPEEAMDEPAPQALPDVIPF